MKKRTFKYIAILLVTCFIITLANPYEVQTVYASAPLDNQTTSLDNNVTTEGMDALLFEGSESSDSSMLSESSSDTTIPKSDSSNEDSSLGNTVSEFPSSYDTSSATDSTMISEESSSTDLNSPTADSSSTDSSYLSEDSTNTNDSAENLDYVLGRPMTTKEIAAENALEPDLSDLTVIPDHLTVPTLKDGAVAATYESAQSAGTPPSYYDSRTTNRITPVKNQNPWGTCWAFAAISQAETTLINNGGTINGATATSLNTNLSERHLAYFFYHSVTDPLGNTAGDSTTNLYSNYLSLGGNSVFTTFALAKGVGAADESVAPYSNSSTTPSNLDNNLAYYDTAHLENAYWINLTDRSDVKSAIMRYGSVAISYYMQNISSTPDDSDPYFKYSTAAYYQNANTTQNHAVTIVGWNDGYSRSNFNTNPGSDGAWLVKNSWSTSWGNAGYFWISYADTSITTSDSKAFVFDFDSSSNYDHNYQYDGSFGICYDSVNNGGSIANVYTASGNTNGSGETLNAVSFALYDTNVNYSIQIYKNLTNASNPTSGTAMLATPVTGTTSYTGYYTIPLSSGISLSEGNTFSVVITLSKIGASSVRYFVDYSYQNGSWIRFVNNTASRQSFSKSYSSGSWSDLASWGGTARIKALTTNNGSSSPIPVSGVTLNNSSASLMLGNTLALVANVAPSQASNKAVSWTTSNSSVARVSNGLVTAVASGSATITATTQNGGYTATCMVKVTAPTVNTTSIFLDKSSAIVNIGNTFTIEPVVLPSNATNKSVTYSSTDRNVLSVNHDGKVTAVGAGKARIIITTNDGTGVTATFRVTVRPGKVQNLSALNQTKKTITLSWRKQTNVDGYVIYRYDDTKKKYIKIATIRNASTVTYTNKNLKKTTRYKYRVRSFKKFDGKIQYGSTSATLQATTVSSAPTLSVTASKNKANLSWKQISSISGYEIYMSTKKSSDYQKISSIASATKSSYTKRGLHKKTTYYFKMRTYIKIQEVEVYSPFSAVKKVKIK